MKLKMNKEVIFGSNTENWKILVIFSKILEFLAKTDTNQSNTHKFQVHSKKN